MGDIHGYYSDTRIQRQFIIPYNPQQNGVVERKNKTICEVAKSMMYDQDFPNSLWEEASITTAYIQNKILDVILGEKTHE